VSLGIAVVALGLVLGAFAWCRFVPDERDRMRHLGYVWVLLVVGEVAYWGARLAVGPLPF
jgi:hypothetical protein